MWLLVLLATVVGANPQYTKTAHSGVKGGYSGHDYQYNAGVNQIRYFGNGTQQGQHNYTGGPSYPAYEEPGVGICFVEVPTSSLVRDPSQVPAGNGSRADLSRIRSCCKGYIRNIHNYRLCDPLCTEECVNALCSAPEICTCFPDHVKNAAGFCIPTCPIGCQNGRCAGGECICKDGFKLDRDSKYCMPSCQENCGGTGNCTAPNTCTCKTGYESTPTGSCKPTCAGDCRNGDCVAPNECRCKHGYTKDRSGVCEPSCAQACGPNGRCIAPNVCSNPITTTPAPSYNPHQPNNPYYPTDYNRPGYNFTSDSQVKPNQTDSHYPYNPITQTTNYPNGPNGLPITQTYPYGPNQPYNPSNPNQPTNYYPQNQNGQPGQYPNNPNGQPGQYPNNPNGQPGQYPNNPNGQPGQYPNSPYGQPGQHPNSPGGQPGQYPYPGYPVDSNHSNPYNPANQYPDQYNITGYEQSVPRCSQPCINGYCVEGNRCYCNTGYELDNTDPSGTRCRPYCAGGCQNGVCSAPNFCICNMGFRKEQGVKGGSPRCVKRMKRSTD